MSVQNEACLDRDECDVNGVWENGSRKLGCDGVIRYDREELVSYFLAFASPEELANHKQVYSIQPLPPDTRGLTAERLDDVNSTAVLSYQRQRERDSNSTRRRKNRTSIRLDEEGGVVEEAWWTPLSKDRKSIGLPRKKSDSPKRKDLGSLPDANPSQPLFDDFTFDFEEDDGNETSFVARGGFFGKSLGSATRQEEADAGAPAIPSLVELCEPVEGRPPPPQSAPPPPPAFAPPPPPMGLQTSMGRSEGSTLATEVRSMDPRRTDQTHEVPANISGVEPSQSPFRFHGSALKEIGSVSPSMRSGAVVAALNEIGSLGSPASRKDASLGSPASRQDSGATDGARAASFARRDSLEAVLSFLPPTEKAPDATSGGFALPSSAASRTIKSPPPAASFDPDSMDLRHRCWRYRDPQGVVQGPFSTLEMQHWNDLGYFSANLPLQHVDRMGPFLPLKAIFPKGIQPFRAPPLMHVSAEVLEECQREEQEKGDKLRADKEAMQAAQAAQALRHMSPGSSIPAASPSLPPQHTLHNIHQLHQQHLASHQYGTPQHAAAAARQKQAAQVHAAQQVAVAAHHAALHGTNTHNVYSGGAHDFGSAKHRLEQQSANIIKNLLHMHQPEDAMKAGLSGLPSTHPPNDRNKQRGERGAAGVSDKNKRDRRKKDKDDLEDGRKEPLISIPPAKPMLQSTQEFPSLGASVSNANLESSHSVASLPSKCIEPEGFWERPPRPLGPAVAELNDEPMAITPTAATLPKEPDAVLDKAAKQLPRRKRGKGVAADPKMLGFVATHRGVSIDHGD